MKDERRLVLDGQWQLNQVDGDINITAQIPGVVHYDLLKQGLIDDPYYRMNEQKQQWVAEYAWDYERDFSLSDAALACEKLVLEFEKIEVLADIYINEELVASVENLFRRYRFDIKSFVKPGENKIRIRFNPVKEEVCKRAAEYPFFVSNGLWEGRCDPPYRNFVRTSQCHFGWDWGLCLISQGMYESPLIEAYNQSKILYLNNTQEHRDNKVIVNVTAVLDSAQAGKGVFKVTLGDIQTEVDCVVQKGENVLNAELTVENPELWWPNGYGSAHLYDLKVSVEIDGELDSMQQRIGLRKLELIRAKDDVGESFFFRINDVDIFAKGANWIPDDIFDPRWSEEQLAWALNSAVEAHHNIIRVWGGGLYERDSFYERCDELGIMVWQDFMFACMLYPTNPEFLDNVREEVTHQVKKLAYHPSLVLWCGNNENEQATDWGAGADNVNLKINATLYDELYIQTIMPIVNKLDPARVFWPSSPSNGVRVYGDPNDRDRGDAHYWGVWHGGKPFTEYLKVKPRFSSEFGFQSFSSPETMDTVTEPEDRNISSEVFEYHQRSGDGNLTILSHISRHFRIPSNYENMLYVSQALQALSLKTACEHWRRIKPHNMGTIIWQLNDIWPVASWSSLEYDGRWKILHYFERKFYSPILISSLENERNLEIWATSDVNVSLNGNYQFSIMDFKGSVLKTEELAVDLAPQESKIITQYKIDNFGNKEEQSSLFSAFSLTCGDLYTENTHITVPFKQLHLNKPVIKHQLMQKDNKLILELESDVFAPFVWVRHGNIHGTWTDNGMHLLPNRKITLEFVPRFDMPSLDEMRDVLFIHNLFDAGF